MKPAPSPFDDVLLLVGKLNYSWTNTESLLIHLIAGLAQTDKERAVIIYLTLNTTRARIDLVERLAKSSGVTEAERGQVLHLTKSVMKYSALRNRYNHSIYAFDPDSGEARTIMMRIADRKDKLKIGRSDAIDATSIADIENAISALTDLNHDFWNTIQKFNYPT